jgi:hypothetical protein
MRTTGKLEEGDYLGGDHQRYFRDYGMAGKQLNQGLAGPGLDKGRVVLFKYHIIKGMTMDGMIFRISICIAFVIMSLMISMLIGTVGGNGAMKDFRMMMMGHQVVSQKG